MYLLSYSHRSLYFQPSVGLKYNIFFKDFIFIKITILTCRVVLAHADPFISCFNITSANARLCYIPFITIFSFMDNLFLSYIRHQKN